MHRYTNLCQISLLIAACLLSVVLTNAQVADNRWIYITSSGNGTKVYLENTYKERANGIRIIWKKSVEKNGSYSIILKEYDCQQGKSRIIRVTEYNRNGNVVDTGSLSDSNWDSPVPDSVGEDLFNKVCEVESESNSLPSPAPPRRPNYQAPEPKSTVSEQEDLGVDYAIITATRANLREKADANSSAIIEIPKGDLVVLLDRTPTGPWYNVVHVNTNQEGWIHNSTIITSFTKNRKPNLTIPGHNTGSYKNPTVEVKNDSDKTMTLKLGATRHIFSPRESKSIPLTTGKYSFHASSPNVIPVFGEQNFELGHVYTWRFYIVTTRR